MGTRSKEMSHCSHAHTVRPRALDMTKRTVSSDSILSAPAFRCQHHGAAANILWQGAILCQPAYTHSRRGLHVVTLAEHCATAVRGEWAVSGGVRHVWVALYAPGSALRVGHLVQSLAQRKQSLMVPALRQGWRTPGVQLAPECVERDAGVMPMPESGNGVGVGAGTGAEVGL